MSDVVCTVASAHLSLPAKLFSKSTPCTVKQNNEVRNLTLHGKTRGGSLIERTIDDTTCGCTNSYKRATESWVLKANSALCVHLRYQQIKTNCILHNKRYYSVETSDNKTAHPVASPAMGHCGTCPLDFQQFHF